MPAQRIKEFLDSRNVPYESIIHSPTFTAQRTAQSTHIKGKYMAKTVVVKVDGRPCMVVIPAHLHVDLAQIKKATGASAVELAHERDFAALFPECEAGAMPPFGNLFGMDVFVQRDLTKDDRIAFNAGTHTEVVRLAYKDFEGLVSPKIGDFCAPE